MATNRDLGVQTTGPDFVMVQDADEDAAGATVWWRLRGDCDRLALLDALETRGLSAYGPAAHSPEIALRRAVAVLRGRRRLVRPLKKGSWAIIEETLQPSGEELKHWTGPTVHLDKIGRAVVKNSTVEEAQAVKDAYEYHFDALTTEDVSLWLITQAWRLGAIALRDSGGIYYLPPQAMREWRQITDALAEVTNRHAVYKVPTVRMTKDGARAILDSLLADIETSVADIRKEVLSGELGVRALETRASRAVDLLNKTEQYESLLGTRLETARTMFETLQSEVVAAKLAAEAAAEDAAS